MDPTDLAIKGFYCTSMEICGGSITRNVKKIPVPYVSDGEQTLYSVKIAQDK